MNPNVRFQRWDEGITSFKGFLQTIEIIGLAIVKAVQRPDIEDNFFGGNGLAIFVRLSDSMDEPEIKNKKSKENLAK